MNYNLTSYIGFSTVKKILVVLCADKHVPKSIRLFSFSLLVLSHVFESIILIYTII